MNQPSWTKVASHKAAEVASQVQLEDEAVQLLRDDLTPAAYVELLAERQQYVSALRFLAHALPKREAVAWACRCARMACSELLDDKSTAALEAAEQWVADPSEAHRRAAEAAAEKAGFDTPAGCAAAAAFFSGGSLGPPHVPDIPPAPTLTAQGVAGSLLLAAVVREPEKIAEKHRAFLRQGVEIASGSPSGR